MNGKAAAALFREMRESTGIAILDLAAGNFNHELVRDKIQESWFVTAWRKILLFFNKKTVVKVENVQERLQDFIGPKVERLQGYHDFLTTSDARDWLDGIRGLLIEVTSVSKAWDKVMAPRLVQAMAFQALVPVYNEDYISINAKRHEAFFSGEETGAGVALNESQVRAILTNDTHVLTIAGPGAGKTRTLTDRVAFYVKKKACRQVKFSCLPTITARPGR